MNSCTDGESQRQESYDPPTSRHKLGRSLCGPSDLGDPGQQGFHSVLMPTTKLLSMATHKIHSVFGSCAGEFPAGQQQKQRNQRYQRDSDNTIDVIEG